MSLRFVHSLRFSAPATHYLEVESVFPVAQETSLDLAMAVWTPGSYLIREYARHVEGLTASDQDGRPLAVEKVQKNRWRIATTGASSAVVRYRLYAHEMSVRTNWVDADFALIQGAATFLVPAGCEQVPHEVRLEFPNGWTTAVSGLPSLDAPSGRARFWAEDYDRLVDSPLYVGSGTVHKFFAGGREHWLLDEAPPTAWDAARAIADVTRVAETALQFWGSAPYERFVFFNLFTEASGGLEHRDSCVLMASRFKTATREGYLDWLGLVGHELFHAWNVKRLRPIEFDRFDYERETPTRSLWIVEGITTYYEDLLLHRAGLVSGSEFLSRLSKTIESVESSPGSRVQPLAEASFDAWIKYYRKDENFANSGVSYYNKGAVVAFLLDAVIRRETAGRRCLDDAMRLAYARYSGERGYTEREFLAVLEEVAGRPLDGWLERALGSGALDYATTLSTFGLRFAEAGPPHRRESAWFGLDAEVQSGRLVVTQIVRGGPAFEAGINVGDELIAVAGDRIPVEGWRERLRTARPGTRVEVLVARRERLRTVPLVVGERPRDRWRLELAPLAGATADEARLRREEWLRGTVAMPPLGFDELATLDSLDERCEIVGEVILTEPSASR